MAWLQALSFSQRIRLLLFIPMAALLLLSAYLISKAASDRNAAGNAAQLLEITVTGSLLVHELQKERGMTAGFLGSQGARFGEAIRKQRLETDVKRLALEGVLERDADLIEAYPAFEGKFLELDKRLDKLDDMRGRVDRMSISLGEALAFYTGMNGLALSAAEEVSSVSPSVGLAEDITAYANFLQSKERAGIERAVLANTFAKDDFGPGMFLKLIRLINTQDIYMRGFEAHATEAQRAQFAAFMQDPAVLEAHAMRERAIERVEQGGFGIDSGAWFEKQTAKIKLLKRMEDILERDIQHEAQALISAATMTIWVDVLLVALFAGAAAWTGLFVGRQTYRELGGEPNALRQMAEDVAQGNFQTLADERVVNPESAWGAMISMRETLLELIDKDINQVLEKAKTGDLDARIDSSSRQGVYQDLVLGVNALLDAAAQSAKITSKIVDDVQDVMNGLANGDLNRTIKGGYPEEYQPLKRDTNATIEKLNQVIGKEIAYLVECAKQGDLSQRMDVEQLSGFFHELGSGMNRLLDVFEQVVKDNGATWNALSHGDLSRRIETHYQGVFAQLAEDANSSMEQISNTLRLDLKTALESAGRGDMQHRIDTAQKEGFFRELSDDLNTLVDQLQHSFGVISGVMSAMAEGDFTQELPEGFQGIYGQIINDMGQAMQRQARVVESLVQSVTSMKEATGEIMGGNTDLSNRTELQAHRLQQTAETVDSFVETVRANAGAANEVNMIVNETRQHADQGQEVLNQAIEAMGQISASSSKITEIISVIDDLTFQTNLLALNASVEAARAGDQGRGFAVVATEVRNLASRSADSAREIRELILDSETKVKAGAELVDESGEALKKISGGVNSIREAIVSVAQASDEQTSGTQSISRSLMDLEDMTSQNASLAEEISAASKSLDERAEEIKEAIAFFRV